MDFSKEMIEAIESPAVHNFVKKILANAKGLDIVDVLGDLEYVEHLVKQHLNDTLKGLPGIFASK